MSWATTDRTVHNRRPDTSMLDKTIKETYLIDIATRKSQPLQHHHQVAPKEYRQKG